MFPSTAEVTGGGQQTFPLSPLGEMPVAVGQYGDRGILMGRAPDSNLKKASAIYGLQPKKVEIKQKAKLEQKI